jgi:hypothetical protein
MADSSKEALLRATLERAKTQVQSAESEGRTLTSRERSEVEDALETAAGLKTQMKAEEMFAPVSSGRKLSDAVEAAGGLAPGRPAVNIDYKAIISNTDDAAPRRESGIERSGADERYLFGVLPTTPLGDATTVEYLKQTARTLAATDAMVVADAGEKPVSVVTAALQSEPPVVIAHLSEYIANRIFGLSEFRTFLDAEMALGFRRGLDDYVSEILLADLTAGTPSGSTEFEVIRRGVADVRAAGFQPNVIAMSPDTAVDVELLADANERFYFAGPSGTGIGRLFGCRVVEANAVPAGDVVILDTSNAARLYLGNVKVDVDSLTEFSTNQSRTRVEAQALAVVRQPSAGLVLSISQS